MPEFRHHCELDHLPEDVFSWHVRPGAFERLAPPWWSMRVQSRAGALEVGGKIRLRVGRGPLEVTWEIEHTVCETDRLFIDQQVRGPFGRWRHEHHFEPREGGRTLLVDVVEWEPPAGAIGRAFSEQRVTRELRRVFGFRSRRLRTDLAVARRYGAPEGRLVAITGSTGLIGTALGHQLEAAGYGVLGISRSPGMAAGDHSDAWMRWDPRAGVLDPRALEGLFAVVHLAGESIAGVRWTSSKKDAILRSREEGTRLLSRTLAELDHPPEVLVSASAVGYYGHRGDEIVTEQSALGEGFLAEVCRRWEASTQVARAIGIRTVHVRSGLVLSPLGGPLRTLLIPFTLGVGGRIGSGRQYLSWIDLDDQTGMTLHAMGDPEMRGALNAASPNPLTNAAFTDVLGRVLRRPTLLTVPSVALSAVLGEMGVELLLSGQRVRPEKALRSGYEFLYPDVEGSLRHQLGRTLDG